jgi:RNA polymerase sigma-70 factor (ECF subfamily)
MAVSTSDRDANGMSAIPNTPRKPAGIDHRPVRTSASDRVDMSAESVKWLHALRGAGRRHDDAVESLHELLVHTAHFEVARRTRATGCDRQNDADDLAMQAADDALMAVLQKLDSFRGDSSFTTWVTKFALLEAATKMRRRAWLHREIPLDEEGWARLADLGASSPRNVQLSELIAAVSRAIAETLTPHQRAVLIAITLNDVPIDVLAQRRCTTRGALYKTLHDARKKLRSRIEDDGYALSAAGF